MGLLFAVAIVLSYLESLIPPIASLPAGIKLGLSNIATMYCLVYVGAAPALLLALLKGGFAFLLRGGVAGLLSVCGGLFSVAVMALENKLIKSASYALISVSGAVSHNLAQLACASLVLYSGGVWLYAPILVISGVVMGLITGLLLKLTFPAISRATAIEKPPKK